MTVVSGLPRAYGDVQGLGLVVPEPGLVLFIGSEKYILNPSA